MSEPDAKRTSYTYCLTNLLNHNLVDFVIELMQKGSSLSAESCMGHYGTCSREAICRINGTLAKGTREQQAEHINGGEHLASTHRIDAIVLNKTGTVTKGKPELTDVVAETIDEQSFLRWVGAAKKNSEHPSAEAIVTGSLPCH